MVNRFLILTMLFFSTLAFSQVPQESNGTRVDIGLSTIQSILQYLETRPFKEVNKLLQAVEKDARIVTPAAPAATTTPPPATNKAPSKITKTPQSYNGKVKDEDLTEEQKKQMEIATERVKKLEEQRKKSAEKKEDKK